MQAIENEDRKKQMRAYGQAATMIGLSMSFVARTIHADWGIAVSVASVVLSLFGLALVFKGANRARRVNIVAVALAVLVAGAAFAVVILHR